MLGCKLGVGKKKDKLGVEDNLGALRQIRDRDTY